MRNHKLLVWLVLAGMMWTKAAALLSMPFLTLFLYKNTHMSVVAIGIIVGLQPLALCFGSILGGYFSDIFRRHIIMLFSVVSSSSVYFGFYLTSQYLQQQDIQMAAFAILNLLNGFCSALFSPASRAIISDLAKTPEEKLKFLHMSYFAINFGAAAGPLFGAYAGIAGKSQAFLITMALYFAYAVFLILGLRNYTYTKQEEVAAVKSPMKLLNVLGLLLQNRIFVALLISVTVFNVVYVQLFSNLSLIINNSIVEGTVFFSWMLSLNAILVVTVQPIIYHLVKNKSQQMVILSGYLMTLACSGTLFLLPIGKISIISFVSCLTIVEILIFPTSNVLVADITTEEHRGTAFGVMDFTYLGSAIGPLVGGMIIKCFAGNGFFGIMAALTLLSIAIYGPFARGTEKTV